jgi:hypothetical protein
MKLVVFADIAALQSYFKEAFAANPNVNIQTIVPHTITGWPRAAVEVKTLQEFAKPTIISQIELHFIETKNVLDTAELLAPMSKWTVFWRNGERDVYEGDDIQDAFRRAGVGAGALSAVDFYAKGNSNEYEWDAEKRNWDRIV